MNYPTTTTDLASMVGRVGYINLKALLYAVACIQTLPGDKQEWSDMCDMCAIARSTLAERPNRGADILWSVEHHVGHQIDLWPAHGGPEPNGLYSDEDMDRRDAVRSLIDGWATTFRNSPTFENAPASSAIIFVSGLENGEAM